MGEELNEDSDGSNNTDKVPDPCVGMYITPYHKRRILNNDAAGVPITKNFNSLVVESGGHKNLPFNKRDMRNKIMNANTMERPHKCNKTILVEEVFHKAYTNSKFKEVQKEVYGLMHTNANKVTEDGSLKIYEYLTSLALHNDATYTMFMEGVNKLGKRLECTLGIHDKSGGNSLQCGGDNVFGRRRLQILEENERYIKKRKRIDSNSTLKDPPDCRGKGRAPAKRQPHPSEKGTANKKMLKKPKLDRNEQIIQSAFSSMEARRGGASGAYDDTLLEIGKWEDGNSQDLSLNSGINWFNSKP
ncbi:hypothetical protein Cgig2_024694 [Carnegiea gigantea]|uniref:Uncharacterized protein n=1 Tax=Carnegiea gigantea TaxID=171969 RepID=A0A9Q1JW68_9CARY|nr:hypothetical protein Cgig2_024694 [Carnegiea gigantea]